MVAGALMKEKFVMGGAGETSCCLEEKYNVSGISMADGPAGLRLTKRYEVDRATNMAYGMDMSAAMEGGYLAEHIKHENAIEYYQYATSFPIGNSLAQSWDPSILEKMGVAVGEEMQDFAVAWWLAPGMNIQRNPLCGRNFEYYSEDPLLSGLMGAAVVRGVQSQPGTGACIKHLACNNQEENRMTTNVVASERAIREIYLRGFEIAVKASQPMVTMMSYSQINGLYGANNFYLTDKIARGEWGYQGAFMTDWTTTTAGGAVAWKCPEAGVDVIMPGSQDDIDNIRAALESGELKRESLRACAKRLIRLSYQCLAYEDVPPYGAQFTDLKSYI